MVLPRDCRSVSAVLSDLIDGRLADAEKGAVLLHVSFCPDCAAELVALKDVVEIVRRASEDAEVDVPDDLVRSVLAAAAKPVAASSLRRVIRRRRVTERPALARRFRPVSGRSGA